MISFGDGIAHDGVLTGIDGDVYTLNLTNKVLTFTIEFHHSHNCSNNYGYVNKNIKKEEIKLCI